MSYEKDVAQKNEILSNLSQAYEKEKTTNAILLLKDEELRTTNESLRKYNQNLKVRIDEMSKNSDKQRFEIESNAVGFHDSDIKTEIIEIVE